ncbi:MAG TPA: alpha/beta fold hydrolase [Nocardioidaceae bacterium]|nr:alpha/beta fold hydrolase [Nocardioidaceae bacterium]
MHPEQTAKLPNGIEIAYDTCGDPADPAVLLIMGLGGPLNWWDADLCAMIASRGFHVIRYDNRDVGRSTKLRSLGGTRAGIVHAYLRPTTVPPYTISDLAADAAGLLDHLGIASAHVTGASMGGMIAQTLAIERPERVLSLVSIMSTPGGRFVGWQDPRLFPLLLRRSDLSREAVIERSVKTWSIIGSPDYPTPDEETRHRAAETFERGMSPSGVVRQMQAVLSQPNRAAALAQITAPTLVIHGLADRLVHVSGGRATARAIPGAELVLVPGMGHDLPRELWPVFVDGIERTAARASAATDRDRVVGEIG